MIPLEAIISTIFGLLLGASLQYRYGILKSKKDKLLELKTNAYIDFIKSLSEITFAQRSQDKNSKERENRGFSLMAEAKARICIYGEPTVVTRIAEFERNGACLKTNEQCKAFVRLVQTMRDTEFAGGEITESEISLLMIGSDIHSDTDSK